MIDMIRLSLSLALSIACVLPAAEPATVSTSASASKPSPAQRGEKALTANSYIPAAWSNGAWGKLWTAMGLKEKPADYDRTVMDYYGLHPAPYPNDGLPMGLRRGKLLILNGISVDCMICHGGSIAGKSYVGLGNSTLDIQGLFEDLSRAEGRSPTLPFNFCNVKGTSEAGAMAVYLMGYRNRDMTLARKRHNLGLHDDLCEDVPAWWILKKKKTMYYDGGSEADSVRSKMQFMMTPVTTVADFDRYEPAFRDIQEYLNSIQPPKYPWKIDEPLAAKGQAVFSTNCATCHGTYGEKWTYPNKIVPIDDIGTDRRRYDGIEDQYGEFYNDTWFAKEKKGWFLDGSYARKTSGYQAPPLDGIWATAPYLHNGSVPTLYNLLKSSTRPTTFTRSWKTDEDSYDRVRTGWKITEVKDHDPKLLSPFERRKVYDTRLTGRSNGGHTYGDDLSEEERLAVLEYLKTL